MAAKLKGAINIVMVEVQMLTLKNTSNSRKRVTNACYAEKERERERETNMKATSEYFLPNSSLCNKTTDINIARLVKDSGWPVYMGNMG